MAVIFELPFAKKSFSLLRVIDYIQVLNYIGNLL